MIRFHLDANRRRGDRRKHWDLVAQLSPESAAPEGIEPELKPRNRVGVDQRFAGKKTWKNKKVKWILLTSEEYNLWPLEVGNKDKFQIGRVN